MSRNYDLEALISDIQSVLANNLNAKLTALDTEVGDGLVLKPVDSNAYFYQSLNDHAAIYDPFVLIMVADIKSDSRGPATSKTYTILVILAFTDQMESLMYKRLYRYHRAIEEVFEDNFRTPSGPINMRIGSLAPTDFKIQGNKLLRAIGCELEVTLA